MKLVVLYPIKERRIEELQGQKVQNRLLNPCLDGLQTPVSKIIHMRKILCPTDFSETAHNAIGYAAKLAQVTGSQLTLFNVQSLFELTPTELVGGKAIRAETVSEQLDAQSREISKVFRISCYAELEITGKTLSTVIGDKGKYYDLIVMGSDGADDLYELFMGSNAYNTTQKTKTPVLVIPRDYLYSEIKKLVFAFDYFHQQGLPLDNLIPFVKAVGCGLTILQVLEEPFTKEVEDKLKELESSITATYRNDISLRYQPVVSTDAAKSIKHYILESKPDALALCAAPHTIFSRLSHRSVINEITSDAAFPVLIFHE